VSERPWLERFGDDDTALPWVLLHGFTGAASSMAALALALAPAAAPHLPGHHPALAVQPGFAANARALTAEIEAAGVAPPWRLCGYSLGARVALAISAASPERVAELWLVGGHPGLSTEEERAARRQKDAELAARMRSDGIVAFVDMWEALPLFASQASVSAHDWEAQRRVRLAHDAGALARSLEEMGQGAMPDYRATIAALAPRTHLVVGALDSSRLQLMHDLAADTGAHLHVVHGAGHNVPLEEPAALAALLGDYSRAG